MVNIMIVEDEKPISNLIALSLKKVGYHCECAYDGLSAIDMIEKKYPDLILLDIMLPGADGFEILEYVKPFPLTSSTWETIINAFSSISLILSFKSGSLR